MQTTVLIAQYQVEPYRGGPEKLRHAAVLFTGSPHTSSDPGKVLLLNDPASQQAFFYEFRSSDILYAEEAPSLVRHDGSTIAMVRLWIRKGATGLKIVPFHVQDTAPGLRDFY
jgi:inorganic pyrophosphatase